MPYLLAGLLIFLGVHSLRIVSEDSRTHLRARFGEAAYKGVYTLASLIGFALIVWGFGVARENPVQLWNPPEGMRHLAAGLTLVAFVLLTAAYVPRNGIKARLHHPMVLGVKVWALAHLLATGALAQALLFGSFLLWAVLCFRAARQRDRAAATVYAAGTLLSTGLTAVLGIAAWAVFAFFLHGWLIGIRPLG
ncbi:NnrU family protein [uncultured Rhodoferax sp.]|uniref:NnrU family protein n=1 Tax=uncultured Rhodoferax sp. TaxID=223188 RepID=UPI0025E0B22E|nr:NnrU family protein [uncultured Rhodoferax sp.]